MSDKPLNISPRETWERYEYVLGRGHDKYVYRAARLEGFYLGGDINEFGALLGGGQWTENDLAVLAEQGRPAYEFNEIRPSVNSAIGYQIHNRMDVAFRPAGGDADQALAEVRTKLAMHILDNQHFHYLETQVFSDGLIEQRGYFDLRMDYADNVLGDVRIEVLDPRDVMPDPDAKSYDPSDWQDVIVGRWLTLDEIAAEYGDDKANAVERSAQDEGDFGESDDSGPRNRFGATDTTYTDASIVGGVKRYRIVDRQQFRRKMVQVAIHPSGDVQAIEDAKPDVVADLTAKGCVLTKRMQKRVYWTVSTKEVMLYEGWSPYPFFTVLPYFPYFRRGKARGMVDIAVGPQQVLNKALSQNIHIVNTTANSGWMVEENSLTNMDTDELEESGSQSGLVLEYRQGAQKPDKIQPNAVPQGIDRLIDRSLQTIKEVTVPDAMRGGEEGREVSGVAIQSKQFASQQQLAVPLDNLSRTRNLVAQRIDWLIGNFFDAERVIRITETDPTTGEQNEEAVTINQWTGSGWLNDMTVGKYDVVVSEQPMQITFENSQFTQALEIRKAGISVPDWAVVKHSNLTDKQEILSEMRQPQQTNPLDDAKVQLTLAQAAKAKADTATKNVEGLFSATEAAKNIAMVPGIAGAADAMWRSAGGQDHDAAPAIPDVAVQAAPPMSNTNPLTPRNPSVGMMDGIEGGQP